MSLPKLALTSNKILEVFFILAMLTKKSLETPLNKNNKVITTTYTRPGVYRVKLKSNGNVLDSTNVFVYSKGWEAAIFDNNKFLLIKDRDRLIQKGKMQITPEIVSKYGVFYRDIDLNNKIEFLNIKDYKVNGDSMIFEAKVKNSPKEYGVFWL